MKKSRTETVTFACGHTATFRVDERRINRNMPSDWAWRLHEGLPCDTCVRKSVVRRVRAMSRERLLAGVLMLQTEALQRIFRENEDGEQSKIAVE